MTALYVFGLVAGIIVALIGILGFVISLIEDSFDASHLTVSCVVILFGVVGAITCGTNAVNINKEYTKLVCAVYSLEDTGEFKITIGREDSKTYYYYRVKEMYSYSVGKQQVDNVNLFKTDEVTPSLYEVKEKGQMDSYYNLYIPTTAVVTAF